MMQMIISIIIIMIEVCNRWKTHISVLTLVLTFAFSMIFIIIIIDLSNGSWCLFNDLSSSLTNEKVEIRDNNLYLSGLTSYIWSTIKAFFQTLIWFWKLSLKKHSCNTSSWLLICFPEMTDNFKEYLFGEDQPVGQTWTRSTGRT